MTVKTSFLLIFGLASAALLSAQRRLVHIDTVYATPYYSTAYTALNWESSHDFDLLQYEIERSEDRQNWEKIHVMPNSTLTERRTPKVPYLWLDVHTRAGKIYWYRLRCVAQNSHFSYLYPAIPYPNTNGIWIEEQPLYGQTIFIQNFDNQVFERAKVEIFSPTFQLVFMRENLTLTPKLNRLNLENTLPVGCYFLRLHLADGRRIMQKLVVISNEY
jgi:hypothetical protein